MGPALIRCAPYHLLPQDITRLWTVKILKMINWIIQNRHHVKDTVM
jgi:hypothetical protein